MVVGVAGGPGLLDYNAQKRLWDYDNILVVDTGFFGTIPQAVQLLSQKIGFNGYIEGILFSHRKGATLNLNLPVVDFSEQDHDEKAKWAASIDLGLDFNQLIRKARPVLPTSESMHIAFEQDIHNAFQRSRTKVTRLVQYLDGSWVPNQSPFSDPEMKEKYRATTDGISAGLKSRRLHPWELWKLN